MAEEGVTTTIPAIGETKPPVETNDFTVPDGYKDKPYMKDITSEEGLYKMIDGAQGLIGKKVTIPTSESSDDERKAFNKQMGVPESSEDYVFEKIGEEERNPEVDKMMKGFLYKYNIPAETATAMQKELEGMAAEALKTKTDGDAKALDLDFDKIKQETFGDDGDTIIDNTQKIFSEIIPENLKEAFNKMSNENLIIMSAAFETFRKKYISEDDIDPGGGKLTGSSKVELEAELASLVAKRGKLDPLSKEVNDLSVKIRETSQKIAKFD